MSKLIYLVSSIPGKSTTRTNLEFRRKIVEDILLVRPQTGPPLAQDLGDVPVFQIRVFLFDNGAVFCDKVLHFWVQKWFTLKFKYVQIVAIESQQFVKQFVLSSVDWYLKRNCSRKYFFISLWLVRLLLTIAATEWSVWAKTKRIPICLWEREREIEGIILRRVWERHTRKERGWDQDRPFTIET